MKLFLAILLLIFVLMSFIPHECEINYDGHRHVLDASFALQWGGKTYWRVLGPYGTVSTVMLLNLLIIAIIFWLWIHRAGK